MGGEVAALWRFMRKSKFNVEKDIAKRTYDGIVFDSVMEMKYYRDVVCPKRKAAILYAANCRSHMNCNQALLTMDLRFSQ